MSTAVGGIFRWFLYCTYAVALTAALLYLRFPTVEFKLYCVQKIGRLFEGVECSIGRITYVFPLGLRFADVAFFSPGQAKNPYILLTSLTLTPVLADLTDAVELSGTCYSGRFNGILRGAIGDKKFSLHDVQIQDIQLSGMKTLLDSLGRGVSGRVDISGTYSAEVNRYLDGEMKGKIVLRDGQISLIQPVLTIIDLSLSQMEMEINYEKRKLQIAKGKMKGSELSADFSGIVEIILPWQLSQFSAAGDIALQADFMKNKPGIEKETRILKKQFKKTTIPFRINGSLQKPTFRFGN